jgi:uncharacterized membrane protein
MNVILLSLIVALFWAINPIIIKTVLKNTSFPLILLLSNLTSFTAVILFSFLNKNNILNDWKKMETKDMYLIITNTLIFGFTATLLYLYLLKNNDVNLIIGLTYMSPIFAIILSKYILKENVTHLSYLGILFIVIGGVLISQSISKK